MKKDGKNYYQLFYKQMGSDVISYSFSRVLSYPFVQTLVLFVVINSAAQTISEA